MSDANPASGWPGRTVECELGDSTFLKIVECWLTRMAKGSKSRGTGSAAPATDQQPATSSSGVLSETLSTLMSPPHDSRLSALELAPILRALLERHFEVTDGMPDEGDAGDNEEAREAAIALADVHASVEVNQTVPPPAITSTPSLI